MLIFFKDTIKIAPDRAHIPIIEWENRECHTRRTRWGVAFGSLVSNSSVQSIEGAMALAFGIVIQNFRWGRSRFSPEKLRNKQKKLFQSRPDVSNCRTHIFSNSSGSCLFFLPILPFALSFAAGAMIYVVVEEVIHESQNNGNTDITTLATIVGFCSYDAFRCCSGLDYIYFHFYKIILNWTSNSRIYKI